MIYDTDFLIDYLKGKPETFNLLDLGIIRISAISVFEILQGLNKNEFRIIDFLNQFRIMKVDYKTSILAGKISRDLRSKGLEIGMADCIISATAIINNDELVTRNTKHFERIPNLKVVSY